MIGENKSEMRRKNMLWLNLPGPNPFSLSVLNVMMIRNPKLNYFNPAGISLLNQNLTVQKGRDFYSSKYSANSKANIKSKRSCNIKF